MSAERRGQAIELPVIRRRELLRQIDQRLKAISSGEPCPSLILVEIVNLKEINRTHGHMAGDYAIHKLFERLNDFDEELNSIFRVNGSSFAVIAAPVANYAFTLLLVSRFNSVIDEPLSWENQELEPSLQIGIGYVGVENTSAERLFDFAENSLALAKKGIPYHEHEAVKSENSHTDVELEKAFKHALQNNDFELYYQPKLNLHSNTIEHVEALLRWNLEGVGFISPERVVAMAEKTNELYALTKWVTYTAVRQVSFWLSEGFTLSVAVNLPANLASSPYLCNMFQDALAIWNVPGELLCVEITESAVMADKNSGRNNLLQLREQGIHISIDDFGTGFSSLSYFKEIPATELKIDRSFVANIFTDQQDRNITELIINIARLFDLSVVAEGIEDEDTLQLLLEMGCDFAQGYHIARPMPKAALNDWLMGLESAE